VSKGVCSPHAHCFWWGANSADVLGVRAGDVLWTALPLFHINAINTFYQALLSGATLTLAPRFSASGFWPAIAASGATVSYVLGAMVPITPPPGPRIAPIVSAPCWRRRCRPPRRVQRPLASLWSTAGSTETISSSAVLLPSASSARWAGSGGFAAR
jgi:hypothetical protein